MSTSTMAGAPPLPPAKDRTKRPQGKPLDVQSDVDSQAENKRRSVNIVKRMSRAIGKALPTKHKVEPPTQLVAAPAPLPPAKMRMDEASGEVEFEGQVPDIPKPLPTQSQRKPIFSLFSRVSMRFKGSSSANTGQALAATLVTEEHAIREGDEISSQPSDQLTPRYTDLPSLMEFVVEYDDDDEERADLLDPTHPKIDASTIVVLAFGEGTIQSGLASSEDGPDSAFPTLCGEPQSFNVRVMDGNGQEIENPIRYGQDAAKRRGIYALEWFNDTENGRPKYNRVGEAMAYNSSHVMRRPLKQDAVILPMHVDMDLERRSKMVCLAFEKVGARAVRICSEEKVALQYVTKLEHPTGIIVDIGHSKTRVVAIVDGEIAEVSLQRTMAGGKTMTARMFSLLKQKTAMFEQNVTGTEFAREAKEKHAFVLTHAPTDQDIANPPRDIETLFHLNDGQDIVLRNERYLCAEVLFQPEKDEGKLSYLKASSVQQCILDCLKAMDRENWPELLRNVVVIGGSAQLPTLKQRLEAELYKLLPRAHFQNLSITIEPFAGWKGAREVALHESEVDLWIPRRDWRSGGESSVQERVKLLR